MQLTLDFRILLMSLTPSKLILEFEAGKQTPYHLRLQQETYTLTEIQHCLYHLGFLNYQGTSPLYEIPLASINSIYFILYLEQKDTLLQDRQKPELKETQGQTRMKDRHKL